MPTIQDSVASRFDRLFSQLLATLEQERELRSTGGSVIELIDIKDRLHALRSELAPLRRHLTGNGGDPGRGDGGARHPAGQPPDGVGKVA